MDEELTEHQHDLLYEAQEQDRHGRSLYIYLLFEHKSYPDKWVLLQLLRYMLKLWQEEVSNKGEILRPILLIIIYHGEAVWPFGTELHTCFWEQVEVLADAQLLRQAAVQAALAPALEQFAQWVVSLNQA